MRRTALLAAALVGSTLVGLTTTTAHADPEPGVVLPTGPTGVAPSRFRLVGDLVYATFGDGLYSTAADGTGSWTPVTDPGTGDPILHPLSYRDGVVLTQPADPDHPSCPALHVATPTHAWSTAPECFSGIQLGSVGRLIALSRQDPTTHEVTTSVYDVESGPAGGALVTTQEPVAVAGTWVWHLDGGSLLGHDLSAALPDRSVPTGAPCSAAATLFTVYGDPSGGSARAGVLCGQDERLVDVSGSAAPLVVSSTWTPIVGDGIVGFSPPSNSAEPLPVTDYSKNPVTHVYGPGRRLTASDTGLPRVAWVDGSSSVHVATVTGVAAPMTAADDAADPTVDSFQGLPRVVGGPGATDAAVDVWWSGSDDESAAPTYRLQVSRAGGEPSTWSDVAGFEDTLTDVATVSVAPHEKTCARVRATDRVGNHSAWTLLGCSVLDTQPPVVRDLRLSPSPVPLGPTRVTFRYRGVDDGRVQTYDVQRRDAPAGGTFDDWHSPRGWHAIFSRQVSLDVGYQPHETCFRVRAHDTVGNVSPWSAARCLVTPFNDARSLIEGPGHRERLAGALRGQVTVLSSRRSLLWMQSTGAAREVWVLASGVAHCPRVTQGGHQVMGKHCTRSSRTYGAGFHWYSGRLPAAHRGRLFIRPDSPDGMQVDAVAVFR